MKKIDTEKAFSKKSSIYSDDNNVVFRSNNDRVIIAISEYPNGKRREFGIEIYDERMEKYVKYEMSYGQMIDMISEIQDRIDLGNKEYNGECGVNFTLCDLTPEQIGIFTTPGDKGVIPKWDATVSVELSPGEDGGLGYTVHITKKEEY